MRAFFDRCTEANLTINLVKSEFVHAQVVYLGHQLGYGQVRPVTAKVQAMSDYPPPQNAKALMRFLGMIGFYRRFCPNLSEVVAPLTNLLKKNVPYVWTEVCQSSFDKAKAILLSEPFLLAPDYDKPFTLCTDASDKAVGSCLMQCDGDGIDRPVCYYSKKLNKHQLNYSTIEKEALALILSLKHFSVYLDNPSHVITVYTDHDPLRFLSKMRNSNQRLMRWFLAMQEYNLDIRHIRGKDNVIADALSRIE